MFQQRSRSSVVSGGDSMVLKGAISSSTIDFGADNDTFTLLRCCNQLTILGGAGADTLRVHSGANLVTTSVSGGAANDSLCLLCRCQECWLHRRWWWCTPWCSTTPLAAATSALDSGADSVSFVTKVSGAMHHLVFNSPIRCCRR